MASNNNQIRRFSIVNDRVLDIHIDYDQYRQVVFIIIVLHKYVLMYLIMYFLRKTNLSNSRLKTLLTKVIRTIRLNLQKKKKTKLVSHFQRYRITKFN